MDRRERLCEWIPGRAQCTVFVSVWVEPNARKRAILHTIRMSTNFQIKHLKVTHVMDKPHYWFLSGGPPLNPDSCMLQIRNVLNFEMTSVHISTTSDLYIHGICIRIVEPSGKYEIINSNVELSAIDIDSEADNLGGWPRKFNAEPRTLHLNIVHSHFMYTTFTISVGDSDIEDYHNVVMNIKGSEFIGTSLKSGISSQGTYISQASEFSITVGQDNVALTMTSNLFLGSPNIIFRLQLPVFMYRNKRPNIISFKQSNVSAVLDANTVFQLKQFKLNFLVHCPYHCEVSCGEIIVMYSMVTIQKFFMALVGGIHLVLPRLPKCFTEVSMLNSYPVVLTINRCKFRNTDEKYQAPVLSLRGFSWLRASLDGGNSIILSFLPHLNFVKAPGLILEDSDLQIYGYNQVILYLESMECIDQLCNGKEMVGMLLSSNSHLLLSNNSNFEFNMALHALGSYYNKTFIPYLQIRITTNPINETFEDFVNCNIMKPKTCPGLCFFQFIDDNGRYVEEEELKYMNTLLHNPSRQQFTGDNFNLATIVNGHFDKCQLQTLSGTSEVTEDILNRTFSYDVRMDAAVPYEICLCQANAPENKTLWNCNQTSFLSVYHGQKVQLLVTLLGDFRKIIKTHPEVVVTNANTHQSRFSTRVKVCTSVYSQSMGKPNETHTLRLQTAHEVFREYILNHYVHVHILPCPPGMIDVGSTCSCNTLLNHTGFTCNVTNDVGYKTSTPHRWIGQDNVRNNNTLIIATYCPPFYCNSNLTEQGVTLDNLAGDVQCENNRRGIMCSQCLDGKSAVFGSFKCHTCSYGWLIITLLFALAGIVIVVILFIFNLTILQGTINGIVLYVNILALMDDFLDEFAVRPLCIPLALINFDLGFTMCFFHGMDEFTKAFLLFVFPIFLIAILFAIVIAAVKCNLKIFRVPFIANRSVPVLGTIMLLTYTDLASAVITALRFTKIYDVTTGNYRAVWLYQPELEYFNGKHIGLAVIVLLVCLVYLIPFTITMLLGDLLRRYIRKLWFSHFMDVLHGAFKWPMGFFFGLRLLLRILLITISITVNNTEDFALSIVTAVIILRVLQQILQPFKSTEQHEMYLPRHLVRKIPTRFVKLIHLVKKLQPSLLDRLFLQNILVLSIVMILSSSCRSGHVIFLKVIVNLFLTCGIVEIAAIIIYHGYKFFPIPRKAKKGFKGFRKCLVKRVRYIVDYCKRNKHREEGVQHPPVIIYDIRDLVPPAVDESDSESESESGNECPSENEMKNINPLEDKLLSKSE